MEKKDNCKCNPELKVKKKEGRDFLSGNCFCNADKLKKRGSRRRIVAKNQIACCCDILAPYEKEIKKEEEKIIDQTIEEPNEEFSCNAGDPHYQPRACAFAHTYSYIRRQRIKKLEQEQILKELELKRQECEERQVIARERERRKKEEEEHPELKEKKVEDNRESVLTEYSMAPTEATSIFSADTSIKSKRISTKKKPKKKRSKSKKSTTSNDPCSEPPKVKVIYRPTTIKAPKTKSDCNKPRCCTCSK